MPDNPYGLSQQDLQDLREIAMHLPQGDPRQAKVSLLLNSAPAQFEQNGGKDPNQRFADALPETGIVNKATNWARATAASLTAPLLHPVETIQGMGQGSIASGMTPYGVPLHAPTGNEQRDAQTEQAYRGIQDQVVRGAAQEMKQHPNYVIGGIVGPALLGAGVGKTRLPGVISKGSAPVREFLQGKAADLYQSALKPSTAAKAPNPARLVNTGLDNGIPVSPAGLEKLGALIDDVNTKIADSIASDPNRTISRNKVAGRVTDVYGRFGKQVNPASDIAAISDSATEFLKSQPKQIPAVEAQAIKQGTYQQLRGKYGELSSASTEAQKALARGIKEELATAFPELNDLNAQDAKLLTLEPALQKAISRIGNHQVIGIGTPIATGAAKAVTGSSGIAAVTGALKAIIDAPSVKSQLAIALHQAGKSKGVTLPVARARVQAFVTSLGAASVSNNATDGDQSTQ